MLSYQRTFKRNVEMYRNIQRVLVIACLSIFMVLVSFELTSFLSGVRIWDMLFYQDCGMEDLLFTVCEGLLLCSLGVEFLVLLENDYLKHTEKELTRFIQNVKSVK